MANIDASSKNMEAIAKAKKQHDTNCGTPAHTCLLHPFNIERMGWEEGDDFMGMTIKGDECLGTGSFRLLCDKDLPQDEGETVEALGRELAGVT